MKSKYFFFGSGVDCDGDLCQQADMLEDVEGNGILTWAASKSTSSYCQTISSSSMSWSSSSSVFSLYETALVRARLGLRRGAIAALDMVIERVKS